MFKQYFVFLILIFTHIYIYIILTKGKDFVMMIERYVDVNIHVYVLIM